MVNAAIGQKNASDPMPENVVTLEARIAPQHEALVEDETRRKLDKLTPAAVQLVPVVFESFVVSRSPGAGYSFRSGVTRADLAEALGKPQLVPYDIKKLRQMVAAGLISETRRTLPTKLYFDGQGVAHLLGAGFEFVYSTGRRNLYGLALLFEPDVMASLLRPAPQPVAPQPVALPAPQRSGLRDRFAAWIGVDRRRAR